jgi:DNA-binding CsgD family transcriptional regulator
VESIEFRIFHRNGEERWIAHICRPIVDADGHFTGRRASNRDITDRKITEKALHKAQRELERRVEERTLELRTTAKELETKQEELLRHKSMLEAVNMDLLETNKAVSVLARNIDREKDEAEKEIIKVIRSRAMPILEEFQRNKAFKKYRSEIDDLIKSFSKLTPGLKISAEIFTSLSSTELRVAAMIKNGLNSQEIANLLNISMDTVKTHRRNIRKKLKLKNAKINLASYLESNMW